MGAVAALAVVAALASPPDATAQLEGMRITPPTRADEAKNEGQRELVAGLARRHLGARIVGGASSDLGVLQRLIDGRFVRADQLFELQAMGVVLGDTMAAELRLRWVAVEDTAGHSRALRFRETEHLFFPVTMISKRMRIDGRADVRAIYESISLQVEKLAARTY